MNEVSIIWADSHLVVVNKPAGLPTLPDGYVKDAPNLVEILNHSYDRVWIVHRLDRDTSGVIVFARSAEIHRALNAQFDTRRVSKIYHAIVRGTPEWEAIVVDQPLRPDGDRRHRTIVDAVRGKPAVTHLHVIERFDQQALIEAVPETGRTHQIRVHLAFQGYPIVADALYGDGQGVAGLTRLGLHARSLAFEHPITHKAMRFDAPYPEDFASALKNLAGFS
jgi:RluA family pseudouridine synthase